MLSVGFSIFSALAIAAIGQLFVVFEKFDGEVTRKTFGELIYYLFNPAFAFYNISNSLDLRVRAEIAFLF